jgi:arsenate reductase-like glutaredoxin family protein
VKEFFRQRGLTYREFDLSRDQEAVVRMLRLTRQKRVPVIQQGDRFLVGFKARELEEFLAAGVEWPPTPAVLPALEKM